MKFAGQVWEVHLTEVPCIVLVLSNAFANKGSRVSGHVRLLILDAGGAAVTPGTISVWSARWLTEEMGSSRIV